jgi:hypothetical protein
VPFWTGQQGAVTAASPVVHRTCCWVARHCVLLLSECQLDGVCMGVVCVCCCGPWLAHSSVELHPVSSCNIPSDACWVQQVCARCCGVVCSRGLGQEQHSSTTQGVTRQPSMPAACLLTSKQAAVKGNSSSLQTPAAAFAPQPHDHVPGHRMHSLFQSQSQTLAPREQIGGTFHLPGMLTIPSR